MEMANLSSVLRMLLLLNVCSLGLCHSQPKGGQMHNYNVKYVYGAKLSTLPRLELSGRLLIEYVRLELELSRP